MLRIAFLAGCFSVGVDAGFGFVLALMASQTDIGVDDPAKQYRPFFIVAAPADANIETPAANATAAKANLVLGDMTVRPTRTLRTPG